MTDSQRSLTDYVQTGSDLAFRDLVTRYVDLVYSTALRLVDGDAHRAQDVTQTVFVDLTRTARTLSAGVLLGGWLHRHTCFVAANVMRGERRRQTRERQAMEMNALQTTPEPDFKRLAPLLDEAINELSEADRTAILLRFFEQHDFRAIGQALASNEDAARMRVNRALEKLQELLKRRGLTSSAAALSVVLSANAVQAAPVGLALTVATAAALTGTTLATTATLTATKAIAMTAIQKTIVATTLAILAGAGIYEASQMRGQVQTLQQQQATLVEKIELLQRERDEAAQQVLALREDNQRLSRSAAELTRLRGEIARLRGDSQELTKLKAEANDSTESAAKTWLRRVEVLKQRLKQTPEAEIPELRFLTEVDWLDVAKNSQLSDETEYRQAFSQLRHAAERKVAPILRAAMNKYSSANSGISVGDLALVKPYLETPLEEAILQRYVIYPGDALQSLKLGGDWLITLTTPKDREFDVRLVIGPRGMGYINFKQTELVDVLAPAIKAYVTANGGRMPKDPTQITAYVTTPEQQDALQTATELIKTERK